MKSKRLIVILCALAFLTVLIVVNSTIFTLQKVSINWLTSTIQLENLNNYDLTNSVSKGGSIFLVNKQKIINKLEKDNSYLRVVSIETVFPNKLVIHSAERESLFAVRMPNAEGSTDYKYAIVDELGKVLDFTSSAVFAQNDGTKPIRVVFEDIPIDINHFIKGENIKVDYVKDLLCTLGKTLREASYTPRTCKGVFNKFTVSSQGEFSKIEMGTRNGMTIRLMSAERYTTDKFLLGLGAYNQFHQDGVSVGIIEVREQPEYGIVARYIDGE